MVDFLSITPLPGPRLEQIDEAELERQLAEVFAPAIRFFAPWREIRERLAAMHAAWRRFQTDWIAAQARDRAGKPDNPPAAAEEISDPDQEWRVSAGLSSGPPPKAARIGPARCDDRATGPAQIRGKTVPSNLTPYRSSANPENSGNAPARPRGGHPRARAPPSLIPKKTAPADRFGRQGPSALCLNPDRRGKPVHSIHQSPVKYQSAFRYRSDDTDEEEAICERLTSSAELCFQRLRRRLWKKGPVRKCALADLSGLDPRTFRKIQPEIEPLLCDCGNGLVSLVFVEKSRAFAEQRCIQKCQRQSNKTNGLRRPVSSNPIEPKEGSLGSPSPMAPEPAPVPPAFSPIEEAEEGTPVGESVPPAAKRKPKPKHHRPRPARRKRPPATTPIDPKWRPSAAGIFYAQQHGGYDGDDLERQIRRFINWQRDHGRRSADWGAAWCYWVDIPPQSREPSSRTREDRNARETRERRAIFARILERRAAVG
jgi:hypothetical protein